MGEVGDFRFFDDSIFYLVYVLEFIFSRVADILFNVVMGLYIAELVAYSLQRQGFILLNF